MLKLRLLTGTTAVITVLLISFWNSPVSLVLFSCFSFFLLIFALSEFFNLIDELKFSGYPRLTIFAGIVFIFHTWMIFATGSYQALSYALGEYLIISLFIVLIFIRVFNEENFQTGLLNLLLSLGGFLYIAWTLSFIVKLYCSFNLPGNHGPFLFFFLIIVTKFGDVGGYTLGKLTTKIFGKNHKMIPRISPKKSWEGLVGGVLFSMGIALLIAAIPGVGLRENGQRIISNSDAVIWGVVLTFVGLVGDLSVSVLKRAADKKDTGTILPGFGGILDLLDSLLFVSPIFYCITIYRFN